MRTKASNKLPAQSKEAKSILDMTPFELSQIDNYQRAQLNGNDSDSEVEIIDWNWED